MATCCLLLTLSSFKKDMLGAFENAEYGLFRVNDKGDPLLTDMVNGEFEMIEGKSNQVNETQIDDTQGNKTSN